MATLHWFMCASELGRRGEDGLGGNGDEGEGEGEGLGLGVGVGRDGNASY